MTAKAKAERKPVMKAYPNLPKEELDALVTYLASLKKIGLTQTARATIDPPP